MKREIEILSEYNYNGTINVDVFSSIYVVDYIYIYIYILLAWRI